ncbi:hypothetical protein [Domibacillus indicus]|uniref:hypothetical protein n=1 Tax=Domibacillus indicus TaxID=1437523 RepID=UPI000AD93DCA|nr:hypothetical protein [Domibacillus indicus]
MKTKTELALFKREIHRLEQEYKNCGNTFLKKEIKADIQLLLSAINESGSTLGKSKSL